MEPLQLAWFVLIAVLWTGYLVLEGFDFGVGMLLPILGNKRKFGAERAERRRRTVINSIAPVWDANEVWLLTAGGATFAAFPEWYATLFSGFYFALFLILVALIVRVCAFEWRAKINQDNWRAGADRVIVFGSTVPAVLWGVAFANMIAGVPIDENKHFTGTLLTLLNPYGLLGGLMTLSVFLLHGAVFIALKTDGEVRKDAGDLAAKLSGPALVIAGIWAIWTQLSYGKPWTWVPVIIAAAMLAMTVYLTGKRLEKPAFFATCTTIIMAVIIIFGSLFPNVMRSSTDPAFSLTIENASSTPYTLMVMTWVTVLLTPLVLIYQGWTYWVFRKRLTTTMFPEHHGPSFSKSGLH